MNSKSKLTIYYSAVIVAFLIGAIGIERLILKPGFPFSFETDAGKITSSENWESITNGSTIESVDDVQLFSDFQLEFILDSKNVGDKSSVVSTFEGVQHRTELTLVPCYEGLSFIIISVLIGIAFLLSCLFVISKRPQDPHARMLFWILMLFGLATLTSPGKFYAGIDILSIITRISHACSYTLGIAAFLHFSFIFPEKRIQKRALLVLIYLLLVIFTGLVSVSLSVSMLNLDDKSIKLYDFLWMLLQSVFTISIILGLYNFYTSYRKLQSKEDKNKVQWILWGITAGVFPYLILFVIPTVLDFHIIIPEQYSMLPMVLIPISFVLAVFKYHIFDIEIIINRSIVYSILTGFIILLYFAVIIITSSLFHELTGNVDRLTSLIAVFIIAFSLNPVRIKIQKFVDRTFYRERYNFERALSSFANAVSEGTTMGKLGESIIKQIQALIPNDKIGLFLTNEDASRLRVLAQKNMDDAVKNLDALRVKQIKSEFKNPFALQEKIQQGIEIDTSLAQLLNRWGLCLIIPMKLRGDRVIGGIVLGKKLSGIKYSMRDTELLGVIASEAAIALKRLLLQEELIMKEIEYQKLEELNSLQSFFVSSVTHDLKTPLTSIKLFTEMLKTRNVISQKKKNEYLSVIEGESDRLAQLIDNVLTYSKIESGALHYDFQCYSLNNLVMEAMELMKYQFKINRFKVNTSLSKDKLIISADKSAIQSVLVNLLSNSIKYSNEIKKIKIKTGRDGNYAFVIIEDKGIGISEEDLSSIFEPFFRSDNQDLRKTSGTGLGLAIVKHTVDHHMGKTEVSSKVVKGSTFKLSFPLRKQETK